jgi:sec-independent protein translocase protein TatC
VALDQDYIEPEKDKEMSFFDHVDELRKYLLRSAYALIILSVLAFVYMDFIFHRIIIGPLNSSFFTYQKLCEFSHSFYGNDQFCFKELNYSLLNTEMAGQFMISFKLAFIVGIISAMPFILWQVWLFIKPALSNKEIKNTRGFVFYTSLLFALGVLFGYYVLCPISVNFFFNYSLSPSINNLISIQNIIGFMSLLVIGTGLIFELPILMYFLARIGLISSSFLEKYRKYAFVIILIVAALVTPPDVVSQIILTIPLYSLFELGIFITKRVERQQKLSEQ